jgi:2-(1,2-epoxy-1,2-dihydrophenyl)acetyl-CoA isomerase
MTDQIDTGTQDLLATLNEGVLTLTLNRPEARNAMSEAMNRALAEQLAWAEVAPSVKCVVLTGAGKGFCAGGDVKGMAERTQESVPITPDEAIYRQRVNQRATARTAILTTAFARVGFSGDYGGTYFLTQLVGSAKARELYYLSERVGAEEALKLGLTNWICEPEELAARTHEISSRLARGPSIAYRYMKENLNRAMGGEVDDCLDLEATHHIHCVSTDDYRDAVRAFVEKREPVFRGR